MAPFKGPVTGQGLSWDSPSSLSPAQSSTVCWAGGLGTLKGVTGHSLSWDINGLPKSSSTLNLILENTKLPHYQKLNLG